MPPVRWRKRAAQMDYREGFFDAIVDGDSDPAGAVREQCMTMLREQLPNSPDLWDKLTPKYNPGYVSEI